MAMRSVKKLIAGIAFLLFSCMENTTLHQVISLPSEFKYLTKHGWYLSELRDTTYEYYDTLVWGHLEQSKRAPAKVGKTLDACTLNTLYFFKEDGTIRVKDCNNADEVLTKWAGVFYGADPNNTNGQSWNLSVLEDSKPIYIPFTDTIPGNGHDIPFTPITDLSDSTKLVYHAIEWTMRTGAPDTPKINETTSVYFINYKVKYRVAKYR